MMKEIRLAAIAALLAVTSTMAQAQSRSDWAGWYAGAFLGWSQGETRWYQGPLTTPNFDTSGLVAGAFGGYNWQSNKLVYGIDGEFGLGEVDGVFFPVPCGGTGCTTELNQFVTLRARLGTEVGNALIYGALGAAWGTFKLTLGAVPPGNRRQLWLDGCDRLRTAAAEQLATANRSVGDGFRQSELWADTQFEG